ncbi:MAG: Fe-S protein assembly co-chaperone HscB [Planctomycetota bacterium]
MDHFEVFDLPRRLGIDAKSLTAKFLELSREVHPDRNTSADAAALGDVQRKSARVNDAYRVLKDRIARAEYLLELEGVERPEGEAKCPPDLLEEVFTLRESMMEGDAEAARAKAKSHLAEAESSLDRLYAEYDEAADAAVLDRLRKALDRRRFVAGLVAEAGPAR